MEQIYLVGVGGKGRKTVRTNAWNLRKTSKNYIEFELRSTHRIWGRRQSGQAPGLTPLRFPGPLDLPEPSRTSGMQVQATEILRLIAPAGFPYATELRGLDSVCGLRTQLAGGSAPGKLEAVDLGGQTC